MTHTHKSSKLFKRPKQPSSNLSDRRTENKLCILTATPFVTGPFATLSSTCDRNRGVQGWRKQKRIQRWWWRRRGFVFCFFVLFFLVGASASQSKSPFICLSWESCCRSDQQKKKKKSPQAESSLTSCLRKTHCSIINMEESGRDAASDFHSGWIPPGVPAKKTFYIHFQSL